jgi:hypothetical protein
LTDGWVLEELTFNVNLGNGGERIFKGEKRAFFPFF